MANELAFVPCTANYCNRNRGKWKAILHVDWRRLQLLTITLGAISNRFLHFLFTLCLSFWNTNSKLSCLIDASLRVFLLSKAKWFGSHLGIVLRFSPVIFINYWPFHYFEHRKNWTRCGGVKRAINKAVDENR